jgi:uncharacterized protein YjbJ (UPF0337 family)
VPVCGQREGDFPCAPDPARSIIDQEHDMSINKDQVAGRVKEVSGATKEAVGKAVGNDELEIKGKVEKIGGKIQSTVGDVRKDVEDAIKKKD